MKKLVVWTSMLVLVFASAPSFAQNWVRGMLETSKEAARGAGRAGSKAAKGAAKAAEESAEHAAEAARNAGRSAGNAGRSGSRAAEGSGRGATHGNGNAGGNGSRVTESSGRGGSTNHGNGNAGRSAGRATEGAGRSGSTHRYQPSSNAKELAAQNRFQRVQNSVERQGVESQRSANQNVPPNGGNGAAAPRELPRYESQADLAQAVGEHYEGTGGIDAINRVTDRQVKIYRLPEDVVYAPNGGTGQILKEGTLVTYDATGLYKGQILRDAEALEAFKLIEEPTIVPERYSKVWAWQQEIRQRKGKSEIYNDVNELADDAFFPYKQDIYVKEVGRRLFDPSINSEVMVYDLPAEELLLQEPGRELLTFRRGEYFIAHKPLGGQNWLVSKENLSTQYKAVSETVTESKLTARAVKPSEEYHLDGSYQNYRGKVLRTASDQGINISAQEVNQELLFQWEERIGKSFYNDPTQLARDLYEFYEGEGEKVQSRMISSSRHGEALAFELPVDGIQFRLRRANGSPAMIELMEEGTLFTLSADGWFVLYDEAAGVGRLARYDGDILSRITLIEKLPLDRANRSLLSTPLRSVKKKSSAELYTANRNANAKALSEQQQLWRNEQWPETFDSYESLGDFLRIFNKNAAPKVQLQVSREASPSEVYYIYEFPVEGLRVNSEPPLSPTISVLLYHVKERKAMRMDREVLENPDHFKFVD